jgi:recombination protein RecA
MPVSEVSSSRSGALARLRSTLLSQHRHASEAAFVSSEHLIPTGVPQLDAALGGGFPRGTIATLEGPPSSGRCTLAARLLAAATVRGLGALVQAGETGTLYPPALQTAGVALGRLLVVPAGEAVGVARAADILLRSGAFGVVAIPAVPLRAVAWTRLAGLAHRANALLIVLGTEASSELRFFASLRVRLALTRVRWAGGRGLFATLAGYDVRADVIKSKRASPGKSALVTCSTFEESGPQTDELWERDLTPADARIALATSR